MTLAGTIYRAGFLLGCVAIGALWICTSYWGEDLSQLIARRKYFMISGIVFLCCSAALAWFTSLKREWSAITAPIYALLEGLFIGILAIGSEIHHNPIVIQAVILTLTLCLILLVGYRTRIIRVTDRFRRAALFATAAIALFYLVKVVLVSAGIPTGSFIGGGAPGILVSVIIVGIAAMNLVTDFDFIEQCVGSGLPKYMEWYAAFGLIVTLIWLYLEVIRLMIRTRAAQETGTA